MDIKKAKQLIYNSIYNETELINDEYFVFNEYFYYKIDDEYIEIDFEKYSKNRRFGNNHITDFLYCIEFSIMNKDYYTTKNIIEEVTKDAPTIKKVLDELLDALEEIKDLLIEQDAEEQSRTINKFLNVFLG